MELSDGQKLILKILIIAAVIFGLLKFVMGIYRLSGNYMYPALKDGDLCFTYRLEDYHTGDVVAYEADGEIKIGRIAAVEFDRVDIEGQVLQLNGTVAADEVFYPTEKNESSGVRYPLTLDSEQAFILNDFRTDTNDSRTYGPIDYDDLQGKLIFVLRRRSF